MARFCWSGGRGPHSSEDSGRELYIAYDVWIAVEVVVVYFLFVETGGITKQHWKKLQRC